MPVYKQYKVMKYSYYSTLRDLIDQAVTLLNLQQNFLECKMVKKTPIYWRQNWTNLRIH